MANGQVQINLDTDSANFRAQILALIQTGRPKNTPPACKRVHQECRVQLNETETDQNMLIRQAMSVVSQSLVDMEGRMGAALEKFVREIIRELVLTRHEISKLRDDIRNGHLNERVYYKLTPSKRLRSPSPSNPPLRRRYYSPSQSPCRGRRTNLPNDDMPLILACHSPRRSSHSLQGSPQQRSSSLDICSLGHGTSLSTSLRTSTSLRAGRSTSPEHNNHERVSAQCANTSVRGIDLTPGRLSPITARQDRASLSDRRHEHRGRSNQNAKVTRDSSLPEYYLNRSTSTVYHLWTEWTVGIGTAGPAVSKLNNDFGSKWRRGWKGKDRQFYSQRLAIMDLLYRRAETAWAGAALGLARTEIDERSERLRLEEHVARLMDVERGTMSLNALAEKIKKAGWSGSGPGSAFS